MDCERAATRESRGLNCEIAPVFAPTIFEEFFDSTPHHPFYGSTAREADTGEPAQAIGGVRKRPKPEMSRKASRQELRSSSSRLEASRLRLTCPNDEARRPNDGARSLKREAQRLNGEARSLVHEAPPLQRQGSKAQR